MKNKKIQKKNTVNIIVTSIIVAGIAALIFASRDSFQPASTVKTVNLPLISAQVKSDDDKLQTVNMNLSLSGTTKDLEALDEIDEYEIALKTIESLRYEDMRSSIGTEIIKDAVLNSINENMITGKIDKVYITGIDLGGARIPGMVDNYEEDSKKSRADQLQSWFGN